MNNILITGVPKSGKSTLLKKVVDGLDVAKTGFITEEVREGEHRTGFEIVTSTREKSLLASVNFNSDTQVSRYFVDLLGFERVFPTLCTFENELLYLDEIGQMQLYSENFHNLVRTYLDSQNQFLGTISKVYDHPLISEIRSREDVCILGVTLDNRENLFEDLLLFYRMKS